MTSATPKPRAGEHTFTDVAVGHAKELDALRERERELVAALKTVAALSDSGMITTGKPLRDAVEQARALLAKHGR